MLKYTCVYYILNNFSLSLSLSGHLEIITDAETNDFFFDYHQPFNGLAFFRCKN